jgi:CDK5 regulatory subunit-associated protein 3
MLFAKGLTPSPNLHECDGPSGKHHRTLPSSSIDRAAMGDDLPIDIDYAKFLDWLLDRRRVAKSWHTSLKAARVLLRTAADSLPADATLTAPTDYYSLILTLTALEDKSIPPPFPGARDTDLLTRYSHPTSRAWSSARSSYESGSAYLAEAAQTLVRAADVEAPALRGEMARLRETIAECARKEGPTTRAAADARARFCAACEDMGVSSAEGVDFEREIRAAVDAQAPRLLAEAVAAAKDARVADALGYYEECTAWTCGSAVSENGDDVDGEGEGECRKLYATLAGVIEGDVDDLIAPVAAAAVGDVGGGEAVGEVDWRCLMSSDAVETGDTGGGGAAIDWGIEIDAAGAADDVAVDDIGHIADENTGGGGIGIDWCDLSGRLPADSAGEEVAPAAKDALTLADPTTWECYANDLLELGAFLSQRMAELSRSSESQISLVLQQSGVVPASVRAVDAAAVASLATGVAAAADAVGGRAARRALGLQGSADAVRRAARDLSERRHAAARLEGAIGVLAARRAAAAAELRGLAPRFETLARETREVISETERRLSAIYRGREVNILGEINVVFPVES